MDVGKDFLNQMQSVAIGCRQCQTAVLDGGESNCSQHGGFARVDGILVAMSTTPEHDFDKHWNAEASPVLPEKKVSEARRFIEMIRPAIRRGEYKVLDVGCGDGAHAVVFFEECGEKSKYFGVDISMSALRTALRRTKGRGAFIQGTAVTLPFPDHAFDGAFSFGVLAYTENPAQAIAEMSRVVKPGGDIGVWIYPRSHSLTWSLLMGARYVAGIVGPFWTRRIADLIVPILAVLPTRSGLTLRNASWRQCREVILVTLAPSQLVFPSKEEIYKWFESAGITAIRDDGPPVTLWGKKARVNYETN